MLATKINHKFIIGFIVMLIIPLLFSCRKLVEADPPINMQSTETTFTGEDGATAAVYGMYDVLKSLAVGRNNAYDVPRLNAFYSDEYTVTNTSASFQETYQNALTPASSSVATIWSNAYQLSYRANSIIEGIENYGKSLPDSLQKQFTGEAKFARAWAYFVLVNVYGDVPLLLTTDYTINRLAARSPQAAVYQQIVSDLLSAKEEVRDYYVNKDNKLAPATERVRANKDVVTAFLAKVYLYMGEWQKAEAMASEVLAKTATYSLNSNLTAVFDNNSRENILKVFEIHYFAAEPFDLSLGNPATSGQNRLGFLSDSVMNKYEAGDKRRTDWIGTRTSGANTWYFPKKYKNIRPAVGPGSSPVAGSDEYVTAMRLAELYLIRAEARMEQNQVATGIEDLNKLRTRARAAATLAVPNPLPALSLTLSKKGAMLALEKEWIREMFMEGHRWFNLKRWKGINNPSISRADELMATIVPAKGGTWQPYKKLFPIPFSNITTNPNLVQNPEYN